jgi:hypothetical protein
LDISSGLPNPTWEVDGIEAEQLAAALARARPSVSGAPPLDGLGYRGLIVRRDGDVWTIGAGEVAHGGRRYRDDGLETALLRTLPAGLRARYGAVLPG